MTTQQTGKKLPLHRWANAIATGAAIVLLMGFVVVWQQPPDETGSEEAVAPTVATPPVGMVCMGRGSGEQDRIESCSAIIRKERPGTRRLAIALFNRGAAYLAASRWDEAIADFDQVIRIVPTDAYSFRLRAYALAEKREYGFALSSIDQAIRFDPYEPATFSFRCWLHSVGGRPAEALADCGRSLDLRPGDARVLALRGDTRLQLGEPAAALEDYDAALAREPELVAGIYGRGVARIRTGRLIDGNADIASATARSPNVTVDFEGRGIRP